MNYQEAMQFINSYTKSGGKVRNLSRAEKLMKNLSDPHKNLKVVHIAGTNGKGSVLEYMSQSLINAGYKTGQFTSPFIRVYEDRIRINSENISQDDVAGLCTQVAEAAGDDEYSQFEITMAIALLYFAREKCDIVFLEAGIGGVFDSTNVVEEPLVSVITSVSVDHTALLGNTIEEIAMQKAGIIKNNRPAVVSWNNQDIMNIFSKECILKNSELIVPSSTEFSDIETNIDGGKFVYKGNEYKVKMHGRHQIVNAASAIKALEVLRNQGFEISDEHIKNALGEVQVLSRVEIIKGDPDIIIDGGHNPAGISALLSTLMSMEIKNAVFIFGMVDTKDIESSAKFVSAFAKAVICVDGFIQGAVEKTKLAEYFQCEKYVADTSEAFVLAKMAARKHDATIVICGSLYMTENFRKLIEGQK